jgi:hypothetical protein
MVLSWMAARKQLATHFVIKMMGGGSNKTYFLDAQLEGKTRYFREITELIAAYQQPDGGFPGSPLAVPVVSPVLLKLPVVEAVPLPPPEKGSCTLCVCVCDEDDVCGGISGIGGREQGA